VLSKTTAEVESINMESEEQGIFINTDALYSFNLSTNSLFTLQLGFVLEECVISAG
jgi:hypothetical protein